VDGGVRVVRDGEPIATLGPGDFFGELSVLDGRPRVAQVVADGPTSCLALASWDFEAVLLAEPRVSLAILRGLAGRLRDLTEAHQH
jgi:CRP/FNR family cyclic AMP-dependent transcriptional regulator